MTKTEFQVCPNSVLFKALLNLCELYDTCDWCLNFEYSFLLAEDGCSLIDDSKSHGFLHAALLGQVSLQKIYARFAFTVEYFLHCKAVAQGEGDS